MKAITARFLGQTAMKGSRITASDEDGNRVTISYPGEESGGEAYRKPAITLCHKLGWDSETLIGGSAKNGYVLASTS